MLGAVPFLVA